MLLTWPCFFYTWGVLFSIYIHIYIYIYTFVYQYIPFLVCKYAASWLVANDLAIGFKFPMIFAIF